MKWKTTLLAPALIFFCHYVNCQTHSKCKTHQLLVEKLKNPQYSESHKILEKQTAQFSLKTDVKSAEDVTIPVVFQIIHDGGNVGQKENLSEVLVKAQLHQLNDDFRRKNSDASKTPSYFSSVASDTEINFRLADFDPSGNPTNGIVRTTLASLGVKNTDCLDPETIDDKIVGKTIWNSKKYLNIYSIKRIDDFDYDYQECVNGNEGGTIGYAQLPESGGAKTDAIVNVAFSFGSTDMPNPMAQEFVGRTITHEVGHWLNLEHIWADDDFDQGDACSGSDMVDDTPNQETSSFGCPSGKVTDACTSSGNGIMYQNYMDYTDDSCMNLYTKGQKSRMMAALLNSRSELLSDQPFIPDPVEGEDDNGENDDDMAETGDEGMVGNDDMDMPDAQDKSTGEILFVNGKIYTVTDQMPWAEAVLVSGDTIAYVGTNAGALECASPETKIINLGKKMMMPGIHDVHMHPLEAGSDNFDFTLDPAETNIQVYKSEIEKAHQSKSDSSWLLGWGHDIYVLLDSGENPKKILDKISTSRPIAIMEQTSHSIWCNSQALKLAGITVGSENPVGGVIMRDFNDEPNGILFDNAGNLIVDLAISAIEKSEENDYFGLLEFSLPELALHGITSICDARTYWKRNHHLIWKKLADKNELTARVNLGLWVYPADSDTGQINTLKSLYENHSSGLLRINQVKVYSDGIVPNTTAAMKEDYLIDLFEEETNNGVNYLSEERLGQYIKELEPIGFDFHIHAIGNRGISESLTAIQNNGTSAGRHRITHLEVVDSKDYSRFAELNVTADCQVAGDFTQPDAWHDNDDFIQSHLNNNLIPLKSLKSNNARLTLSSDWDVSDLNPFVGMQNAVTRKPQEISLEEAIKAYTINGSYVMRQEDKVGTIEVGKEADLIVLDQNIFEVATTQIADTKVMMTFLQGKQIYPIDSSTEDGSNDDEEDGAGVNNDGSMDSTYVDINCLEIAFPISAIFAGDSIEINSVYELQALLALCEVVDTFEIADTTAIDDFDLCLRFVFPLEILFGGDTITVTDEDGLLDFVEERDSLNQLFDFVYPLNLIYQGIDTSVHSIIELIGVVETCAEVIGDLLTRNSTRLLRVC